MPKITVEDEQTLRAEIVAYLATVPLCGNVFDRRRKFNSRQDFLTRAGVTLGTGSAKTREVRFVEVELLNVEDSPDEGFDDCPVAILTYGFHCFQEFNDGRADGSNSDKDFTDLVLTLRRKILDKRTFVSGRAVIDPALTPAEGTDFSQFGPDTFTDIVGHWKDLNLKVLYYDSAN